MKAYVNHGRWVAECATPQCNSAVKTAPDDSESYVCSNCHQPYGTIGFPDRADAIWAVLENRIVPETRNWLPGETVADLLAENREHQDAVT